MTIMTLNIDFSVRNANKKMQNLSVLANVTSQFWNERGSSIVERSEKKTINEPDWSYQSNTAPNLYMKRHNGFRDQELYQRMSAGHVKRQGTFVKYYTTTYDPYVDPLYKEDNNREIDRYFDIPLILSFQPENEIYNRFGIQHTDEYECYLHMALFLEHNYASLRKNGIQPACNPSEHNPVWWQRGYESFRYHGYTFEQISPKAGDMVKIEAFDILYEIETVQDASPEYQHRWRKYWWKLFLRPAMDDGMKVSDEVLNDPEQEKFINTLIGNNTINPDGSAGLVDQFGNEIVWPFDVSKEVDKLKKDIIFRPPEVNKNVQDVTCDPKFYPCGDLFGQW